MLPVECMPPGRHGGTQKQHRLIIPLLSSGLSPVLVPSVLFRKLSISSRYFPCSKHTPTVILFDALHFMISFHRSSNKT